MTDHLPSARTRRQVSVTLACVGLVCGLLLSVGLLAGDAQGRVNLLYLLLLYAFVPAAGLLLSLLFFLRDASRGFSGFLLDLPLWPAQWRPELLPLAQSPLQKPWFFYQTQLLSLSFGLGALLGFFLMLAGSDVGFVWRSTLLQAEDVYPPLRGLALPWFFWEDAQPSLELLRASRDFRLDEEGLDPQVLARWWQFLLAAQLTWNLLPRTAMLLWARAWFQRAAQADGQAPAELAHDVRKSANAMPAQGRLAPLKYRVERDWDLVDWAAAPEHCKRRVFEVLGAPQRECRAGPLASLEEEEASLSGSSLKVVLVKSWEPPMGELHDYLVKTEGLVLPLDWDERQVKPVRPVHLQEWRRFCGTLEHWPVLQLEEEAA